MFAFFTAILGTRSLQNFQVLYWITEHRNSKYLKNFKPMHSLSETNAVHNFLHQSINKHKIPYNILCNVYTVRGYRITKFAQSFLHFVNFLLQFDNELRKFPFKQPYFRSRRLKLSHALKWKMASKKHIEFIFNLSSSPLKFSLF